MSVGEKSKTGQAAKIGHSLTGPKMAGFYLTLIEIAPKIINLQNCP